MTDLKRLMAALISSCKTQCPLPIVFNWGPYYISAGTATENQKYGKIWLTPYNTNKSSSATNPVAYTWYDDLIISRNQIADPGGSTSTDTTPPVISSIAAS